MRRRPRSLLRSLFRDGEEIALSTFHPSSSAKKARKRALPARADLPSFFCFGKQLEADLYVGPSLHVVVLCRRHCCFAVTTALSAARTGLSTPAKTFSA